MKLIKKLALLCASLTLCAGVCSMTACFGDEASSSSAPSSQEASSEAPAAATGYKFKVVKADGTPAAGYHVLICLANGACNPPAQTDSNGEVTVEPIAALGGKAGEYEIHVMDADMNSDYLDFDGLTITPSTYNTEAIVLTLK